jgi:hypothetical protein
MIISDLNYLESTQDGIWGGGFCWKSGCPNERTKRRSFTFTAYTNADGSVETNFERDRNYR